MDLGALLFLGLVWAVPSAGQTFAQLTDLGENVGPRLTRAVTQNRIHHALFGRIGTKVSFLNNGVIYQFATDPDWGRVLIGNWDMWVHGYDNSSGPGGHLGQVEGIDISARRNVYMADRDHARVVIATFDLNAGNLVNPSTLTSSLLQRPMDVAWDGGSNPLTSDYLYIVDDSAGAVTYWNFNAGIPTSSIWSYGTKGTGTGQFWYPSGVCVGKTAASTGGTQFTSNFYVADRGNKRLVWLSGGPSGASWVSTVSVSGWDPVDCAVDHFGNVYVVDWAGHRIHKFTSGLSLLASYGTYGTGASNLNTLAFPHAISVPCGLRVVNSQTVWYCEGRVVTAELWSDATGAVEHYLGVDGAITAQPQTDSQGDAWFSYSTTDHGTHQIVVADQSGNYVYHQSYLSIYPPGVRMEYWSGQRDDGTPAPAGTYWFQVLVTSGYGCNGQSWCQKALATQSFYHVMSPSCGPGSRCSPPVGGGSGEPATLFLRQRIVTEARPLAQVPGPALAAPFEAGSGLSATLTDLVRQFGVRGLAFAVTRQASTALVSVRVYSLAGRLIRILVNQQLTPGFYEISWDGNDDRGRPAAPGVYTAVMTANSFQATQHLILRQP